MAAPRPRRNPQVPNRFTDGADSTPNGGGVIVPSFQNAFKSLPRGGTALLTGLPDMGDDYDQTNFSNAVSYEDRMDEVSSSMGPIPRLVESNELITKIGQNAKTLFGKYCAAFNTLFGASTAKTPDEAAAEIRALALRAQGMLVVFQEIAQNQVPITMENPVPLVHRLGLLCRLAKIIEITSATGPFRQRLWKIGEQIFDFGTETEKIDSTMAATENRLPAPRALAPVPVDSVPTLPPTPVMLGAPVNAGGAQPAGGNPPQNAQVQTSNTTTTIGWRGDNSCLVVNSRSGNSLDLDKFVKGAVISVSLRDLPAKFEITTVTFQGKCVREYIIRNEIPVFSENLTDPLALSFGDFWDCFYNAFHKYTYDSFPPGERLFALEKYTDGTAQVRVQAFRNMGMDGYIECIQDLYMRFGGAGATMEEVKAQLTALKPTGFSRSEIDRFLAAISTCRVKLISLGEVPADAGYAATMTAYLRLPSMAMSTFTSMFCPDQDFRHAARKDPDRARITLQRWISNNLTSIEEAGGRTATSDPENTYSLFLGTQKASQVPQKPALNKGSGAAPPSKTVKPKEVQQPEELEQEVEERPEENSHHSGGNPEKARFVAGSRRPPPRDGGKRYQNFKCNVCQTDEHHWNKCPVPLKERKKHLVENGRCYNCTSQGHSAFNCRSEGRCMNCAKYGKKDEKHHTSICFKPPKDAPQGGFRGNQFSRPENPEREGNPDTGKRQKHQSVLATFLQDGSVSADQAEAIRRTLGLENVAPQQSI